MWLLWILAGALAVLSVLLLSGRGGVLVAGYNTMEEAEKARYDERKICRRAGLSLLLIDLGLLAVGILLACDLADGGVSEDLALTAGLGFCAYVIVIVIVGLIRGFRGCER